VIIYLDAPGDVLLRRKGEGTIESLNRQRAAYRRLVEGYRRGAIIDANRDIDDVTRDVAAAIVRLTQLTSSP
jgi:thymidylate kinase